MALMDSRRRAPHCAWPPTFLCDQTEQARAKGIFGAPTFFVGTEMFWGNDRLDDALLFAAKQKV